MTLPENLLHFIWKYRLYHAQRMVSVSGNNLDVLDTGTHNTDAGADFQSARIRIGTTEWSGNVEIHWRASEWELHRHHRDPAYNNVILHVVYEYDRTVARADGTIPETLELKPLIPAHILPKYCEMMEHMHWIPCEKHIHRVSPFQLTSWLSRLLIARFEHRVAAVYQLLGQQRGSWEDTCYLWMARSFGFKVNAPAFEQLAYAVPFSMVTKYRHRPTVIEALFFGQAGLLDTIGFTDDYPKALQAEYAYLRKLHGLLPMDASAWKSMRTRPGNFPSMRIAQFAAFCQRLPQLLPAILETPTNEMPDTLFNALPVNDYWNNHYRFDVPAAVHSNQLGERSMTTLLINAVSVILFAYGKYIGKEMYIYRAIALLERLKAEDNAIIRRFSTLGVQAAHAAESQALLQLKACYCDNKKCLDCSIGLSVIKYKKDD